MKSCFFIGHRDAGSSVFPALADAVEKHITEYGVTEFIVGNYGSFDQMTARAVIEAKKRHPQVTLFRLLAYHPADRPQDLPEGFDGSIYPENMETVPKRLAIVRANRYAVEHVGYLIAYVWHPASNSLNLLEYARSREQKGLITVTVLDR